MRFRPGLAVLGCCFLAADAGSPHDQTLNQLAGGIVEYTKDRYPGRDLSRLLYVSIQRQRLYEIVDGEVVRTYSISTAVEGPGNIRESARTPIGLHAICRKIGEDVPLGGIFKGRLYTGRVAEILEDPIDVPGDDVTTRILWLCGQEPGINKGGSVDSRDRFIYIHGTPEEGLLGTPASQGCVRMANKEIVELFDAVPRGTPVLILDRDPDLVP